MALNEFGAGFKIYAKDFASGVFGRVGKNFSAMSKKAESDAGRMSAGLARVGKGMAMMGAGFAIVKPMQLAVRESSKLNKALAEVSTLTDEATFPMAQMKELVKGTAEQFGQDATVQAKALYQTISAGYGEAEQAAKMLETANKLAVGGVTEVDTAVDGLTNIMNTYSAANLDALDVSDAMFISMKEGKTTIGEISSNIGKVAPAAEAMGIKFDEVLGVIAAVTSKGIKTSETIAGMGAALANINKPTKDAADEAKRLGIQFDAASLRSKGLKGFLDQITGSAKFNKDSIAKLFGSIEAFKTMTALTTNESEKFNNVMEKMQDRVGTTETAVAKMEATFEHQAKRFTVIRQNILSSIGDTVEGILAPMLTFLNKAGSAISSFIDTLPPGVKKTIMGFVGGFGAFIGLAGGIMVLSGAFKILGVSITGTIIGFAKMMLVMLPVTILVAGLGVAVYAMYRAFQKNTGGITTDWQSMAKKISIAWKGMMKIISGDKFSTELNDQLAQSENIGVRKFLVGFGNFTEKISHMWTGVITGFERGVDNLADSSAMNRLKESIHSIVLLFKGTGEGNDENILKNLEKQGESTGERLAAFGEIALQTASNILILSKQFATFLSGLDVEEIKTTMNGLVSTFEEMSFALGKIGSALKIVWKLMATVINGFQFLGAVGGEFAAAVMSGDFSQGFEAAAKHKQEFDRIWNPENYKDEGKAVASTVSPVGLAVGGAKFARDLQVESLKKRASTLNKFVEQGSTLTKGGKDVRFKDLSSREQADVVRAIGDLGRKIEELANRPINLEMDGEKVAEKVADSDEANGVRDFDPAFGY